MRVINLGDQLLIEHGGFTGLKQQATSMPARRINTQT
jgi:hypothetical protein